MTERLYFEDPLATAFEGRVAGAGSFGGWASVVLDRSAFYPEAGGQMADRGVLRWAGVEANVVDVQVDDGGVVHHRLELPAGTEPPAAGVAVAGTVDRARRRLHMALHTGQHMLSRALLDEASAATVSARLGESGPTIDLDVAAVDEAALARAEALVNAVIDDDRVIRAYFPSPEELAGLALRRAPKVERDVRVVDVDGFDVSPCGGTHCTRTAQVGLVKITGVERAKGKIRIGFVAGARAREELGRARDDLASLARELTCGPAAVATAVAKLRTELGGAREAAKRLTSELGTRLATELVDAARANGEAAIVAAIPGASVDLLRVIAGAARERFEGAALLAGADAEGVPVIVSRHPSATLDCGKALRALATAAGGRGGGRPDYAEGRLPPGADFTSAARLALAQFGQTTSGAIGA